MLSEVQKELIKGYHGRFEGFTSQMPTMRVNPIKAMKIMSTIKTWRTCWTCRGARVVQVIHEGRGIVTTMRCLECKGQGGLFK